MINLSRVLIRSKSTVAVSKFSSLNECIKIVKSRDYENYLCSLLINSKELTRVAIALRAFNSEIACIKDVAKNKDVAVFRFQYWNQSIDRLFIEDYYPPMNEPISSELKRCLERVDFKVPVHWFKKLIESRMNNLNSFPFSTLQELETYQEQSVSPIYYLLVEFAIKLGCFQASNVPRIELDHIASHLGKSQGILNMLRGLYRNALNEECHIPNDLLAKHNCTHEDVIRLCYQVQKSATLNQTIKDGELEKYKFKNQLDLIHELASLSKMNLNTALHIYKKHKVTLKETNYLFLPIYLVHMHLSDLEKKDFNIFDPKLLGHRRRTLPIKLYFNSFEFKFRRLK